MVKKKKIFFPKKSFSLCMNPKSGGFASFQRKIKKFLAQIRSFCPVFLMGMKFVLPKLSK
jgi:hypothetical protein